MGRKTIDDPRTERKTLRFTPAELLASEEAAAAAGLTWSEWVRGRALDRKAAAKAAASAGGRKRSARSGADRSGEGRPPLPEFDPDRLAPLRPLFDELHHQGVNLNQIAHRMHRHDMAAPPPDFFAVLEAIKALLAPAVPNLKSPPEGPGHGA